MQQAWYTGCDEAALKLLHNKNIKIYRKLHKFCEKRLLIIK